MAERIYGKGFDAYTPEDQQRIALGRNVAQDGMENAVAACRGVEKPFFKMRSHYVDGILTVTLDNGFAYVQQKADGTFQSTREGVGLGLRVITALVEKHGGGSRFEAKDGIFYSSVYLRLV